MLFSKKRFILVISVIMLMSIGFNQAFAAVRSYYALSSGLYFTNIEGVRNTMYFQTIHTITYVPQTSGQTTMWPMYATGHNVSVQFYELGNMLDYTYNVADYISHLYLDNITADLYGFDSSIDYNTNSNNVADYIYGINRGQTLPSVSLLQVTYTDYSYVTFRVVGAGANVMWYDGGNTVSRRVLTEVN